MATTKTLDFKSPEEEPVEMFTISSKGGLEVDIISFGATITSLRVPNKKRVQTKHVHLHVQLAQQAFKWCTKFIPLMGDTCYR